MTAAPQLRARRPAFGFDAADIPRHWYADNVVATHISNGVNLLFPAGERFFVRSVKHYLEQVRDPALREQVRGFFGQEGSHAREHERFFEVLTAQGYDVARYLRLYERVAYRVIERVSPPWLRLSTTAACEHFTALLAEDALGGQMLDRAHPALRALLRWHAAEEIEHRAVAFDVLQQVAPGYPVRMAGLAMAAGTLGGFWALGTASLMAQEDVGLRRVVRDWVAIRRVRPGGVGAVFLRGIADYVRPDFHPSQRDTDRLAAQYLAAVGLS